MYTEVFLLSLFYINLSREGIYSEKNFKNADGGIGDGGIRPPASWTLARKSGHWSAMQGCPNDLQKRQQQ